MKPVTPGTKTAKVLSYLQTGHSLDFPKAIGMWGHIRLSDVVFRLRGKGYNITTEIVKNGNVEYAIYRLPKTPTRDTKKGTRVKVTSLGPESRIGQVGFLRCHSIPGEGTIYQCYVHIVGETGTISFNYNELEII